MRPRLFLVFFLLLLIVTRGHAQNPVADSMMNKLNAVLADKDNFVQQKLSRIEAIKRQAGQVNNINKKYDLYQQLYNEYKNFSYDSAYNYAKKLLLIAGQLNDPGRLALAKMELSFTLISSGMFKETLETLNSIDLKLLSNDNKTEFYFLKARSYFDL